MSRSKVVACLAVVSMLSWNSLVSARGLGGRSGGVQGRTGIGRSNLGATPSVGRRPAMTGRSDVARVPTMAGRDRIPSHRPQVSMPHLDGRVPSDRPTRDRPKVGNADIGLRGENKRPNSRPSMPDFDRIPSGRPSGNDLGTFLGIEDPIRPSIPGRVDRPTTLPGNVAPTRPELPRNPERPVLPNRPDPGNRLPPDRRPAIDIDDINLGVNTTINNRPNWVTIDNDRLTSIDRRLQNRIAGPTTLPALAPDRLDHLHGWGNGIRDRWNDQPIHDYFEPRWWSRHSFHCSSWHYFYAYSYYPHTYWWTTPAYTDVTRWFAWNAPAASWRQPVYYDYGSDGNVTYQDNTVYVGGEAIASATEYAESAAALATVPEPSSQQEAEDAQWMPLGTFALTTDPDDVDPSRIVQLAVNKQGVVSGTLYNRETDETQAIQGRVDKMTQRVALRVGGSDNVIAETGLYNLTQDEASLLVHFGGELQDTYLLVRLPSPTGSTSEYTSRGQK
ncbi:MAG: mu-protocadherin- cell-suface protein [Pirellulaceae bacterium]